MPISSDNPRLAGPYTGTNTTATYSFSFPIFAPTDILVEITDLTPAQSIKVLGVDYSVAINADQTADPGGEITLVAGDLQTGYLLSILGSEMPYTSDMDLPEAGRFSPSVITMAIDRLVVMCQQIRDLASLVPGAITTVMGAVNFTGNIGFSGTPTSGARIEVKQNTTPTNQSTLESTAGEVIRSGNTAGDVGLLMGVVKSAGYAFIQAIEPLTSLASKYLGLQLFGGDVRIGSVGATTADVHLAKSRNGDVRLKVENTASGAAATAGHELFTATANSSWKQTIFDNAGAPYAIEALGSAITRKEIRAALHRFSSSDGGTIYAEFGPGATTFLSSSQTSFQQIGTGAVVQTVQNKLRLAYSIKDFGAVCDGATNDTAAVAQAITNIGVLGIQLIIPGPTLVNTNLTFGTGTELVFANNGKLIGAGGAEVITVTMRPIAGRKTIFQNCAPITTSSMEVFPEWFGATKNGSTGDQAAFTKAYAFLGGAGVQGGTIRAAAGRYALTGTITGITSRVALIGAGKNATWFYVTALNTAGIQAYGVSVADPLVEPSFKDFTLRLQTTATAACFGLDLQFATFPKVENVEIADFLYGFKIKQAPNGYYENVFCSYQGSTVGCIMYVIDGDGGLPSNASTIFRNCGYTGNANISIAAAAGSIGYRWTGAYMSDMKILDPDGTQTAYGIYADFSTAGNYCEDVMIGGAVIDQFTSQGVFLQNMGTSGAITIDGGWFNAKNTGAQTDAIYLSACRGVSITGGAQIIGTNNYGFARGVTVIGSSNVMVDKSTIFRDNKYNILATGSSYNRYGGRHYNSVGMTATNYILLTGETGSLVDGCIFDGYAARAVDIDATSVSVGIVNSAVNQTNIPVRFTNGSIPVGPGGATGSTGNNIGY